jgi:heavy metal sensor kinase
MMLRSFRLKIGLLCVVLFGVLLVAAGWYAEGIMTRISRARIDRELRALADSQIRMAHPPGHWPRFYHSVLSMYRSSSDSGRVPVVLQVSTLDGSVIYASDESSTLLPKGSLPLSLKDAPSDRLGGPPAAPEGHRPGNPVRGEDRQGRPLPQRPMNIRGPVYRDIGSGRDVWRAMTVANEVLVFSLAMDLSGVTAEIGRFRHGLLVASPLVLFLLVAGGWLIGQTALRPVKQIAATAETVTAQRLDARIAVEGADQEFEGLIAVINRMLERLERSFKQAQRFSSDAAHELKTPLAVLQAQLERSMQQAAKGSPEQQRIAEQMEEVNRLKDILRKLLLLSQADAAEMPISRNEFDFTELVQTAADDISLIAPERHVEVRTEGRFMVNGDRTLLSQVLHNLVSNAIKFGDEQGRIIFSLRREGAWIELALENSGSDIPAGDQEKIFDRFYRGDTAHGRETEGTGLGLSLAREIARAHGGDLVLDYSRDGMTSFILRLP